VRRDAPVFIGALVIAVLVSLLTGATAAHRANAPVGTAPVTARTLVCPVVNGLPQHTSAVAVAANLGGALSSAVHGDGTVAYTVLGDAGKKASKAALRLTPTGEVHGKDGLSQAVVITSTGTIASTVVADSLSATLSGRYRGLAGGTCLSPQTDWWFAGGNGKLGFTDRLVLANPTNSQANVAVTAWTPNGEDSPPRLADIRIPALTRMSIGILAVAPNIETVAMHVHAESGAVTAAVVDRRSFGLESDGGDLVPPTLPPSRHPVVAGYPAGPGTRTLVLANPGTGQASIAVKVVTPQGAFTPSSVKPIDIGPGRTTVVDLTKAFNGLTGAVMIDSDQPVLAEGRSITIPGGRRLRPDLIWLAATHPLSGATGVAIGREPDGGDTLLLLSAPEGAGSVRLTTPTGANRIISVPAGHSVEVDVTDTVKASSGRWPFVVTPIGGEPIYGTRILRFHGAHGSLITSEPLIGLPTPIPLPRVRQDPRIAVR
jgi:hypothetical protein